MATWQEGNGGSLLAGIGRQNINAPQASDINTTLGLIRDNNDIARSGANNVGLQTLQGLQGLASVYQQDQQRQAQAAFNQAHANAWKTGDTSSLRDFAAANPAFINQAQQAFSGLKEQQRNDLGDLAMRANVALSQGPEVYSKFVSDNKSSLQAVGANPDWMIQTGVQNPDQLSHMLTTMSLGALGPEKALDFANKQQQVGIDQQNADTSQYSAQQRTRQGDEQLELDRFKAQTDNQLRTREMSLKARIENASNDLAREKLNAELSKVKQAQTEKLNEKINTAAGSIDNLNQALGVGHEIAAIVGDHPSAVSRAQGGSVGWAPNWADDTRTLSAKAEEYNTKMILPILKGTFGANPTEGERASLMQSVNSLRKATNNADFMRELNKTQDTIVRMQKRQISDLGIPVKKSSDEATDTKMLLQDPSLVKEYITAHGYLPESYYQAKLKGGM